MGARAALPASPKCLVEFEVAFGYESDDAEQARSRHELRGPGLSEASERQEQWRDHDRRTRERVIDTSPTSPAAAHAECRTAQRQSMGVSRPCRSTWHTT